MLYSPYDIGVRFLTSHVTHVQFPSLTCLLKIEHDSPWHLLTNLLWTMTFPFYTCGETINLESSYAQLSASYSIRLRLGLMILPHSMAFISRDHTDLFICPLFTLSSLQLPRLPRSHFKFHVLCSSMELLNPTICERTHKIDCHQL